MVDEELLSGPALPSLTPGLKSSQSSTHADKDVDPESLSVTTSKHWRKIRGAVTALAAFRSRKVRASDFERVHLCGEGGSGLVYLVKLKNTAMYFALKVQRKKDLEAKERKIRRALIEREVLVTCAHPFVCSLYTAFQDTRHLYLLMDYCAGGDLASLIRNVVKRPLTEEEARFYTSEIVAALEWIHLHGYVYRDLKPENVLIHESGHIRLGDFGTAERGSTAFSRQEDKKAYREEVESALLQTQSESIFDTVQSTTLFPEGGASVASASNAPSEQSSSTEGDQVTPGTDTAKRLDKIEGGRCNIMVQVDPALVDGSKDAKTAARRTMTPSLRASRRWGSKRAVASTKGDSGATTPRNINAPFPPVDDRGLEKAQGQADPAQMQPVEVGCRCGRAKGDWKRSMSRRFRRKDRETKAEGDAPEARPVEQHQPFCQGRGSVKLNVFLDSQTFIGTADFMAPEMVTGIERQGTAMDWWALGVMLYEMTLGTLPFNINLLQTDEALFRSIVNADVVFPRRHGLSASTVDFIEQLLRKDPSQRLGERKGVGEIKRHPFFEDVHWALIANRKAPFQLFGPDTPGWAASVESTRSADSNQTKMAAWTWEHSREDQRPRIAHKGLPGDRAIHEHEVSSSTHSLSGASEGLVIPALTPVAEGQQDTVGRYAEAVEKGAGVLSSKGQDEQAADGADTGTGVGEGGNEEVMETPCQGKLEGSGGVSGGSGHPGADHGDEGTKHKAFDDSFVGYDFNTVRKVGSVPPLPALRAARSTESTR